MRSLAIVGAGFLLLVLQASLGVLLPSQIWAPNLLLPVVIYLGAVHDMPVVRGTAVSFVLGYLLDTFCGSPMGLQTFVMVATYLVTRGTGLNFFTRGPVFQIALTFICEVISGGSILALRAIFEPPAPFPATTVLDTLVILGTGALVTALLSPFLLPGLRRFDLLVMRRRDEGAVAS